MKTNKAIIIALMAAFTTMTAGPAMATDKKSEPPVAEIKFLGNLEKNPVFQLDLNNSDAAEFIITIKDESGTILYSERLSGKNISRKYRIDTDEEIGDGGLRFEVKSIKTKKTDVYEAMTSVRYTREIAVNKVQ